VRVTRAEFAKLETKVEQCCQANAIQFRRIAELQATIDRLTAARRPSGPRL
jgi:hypothetical protein